MNPLPPGFDLARWINVDEIAGYFVPALGQGDPAMVDLFCRLLRVAAEETSRPEGIQWVAPRLPIPALHAALYTALGHDADVTTIIKSGLLDVRGPYLCTFVDGCVDGYYSGLSPALHIRQRLRSGVVELDYTRWEGDLAKLQAFLPGWKKRRKFAPRPSNRKPRQVGDRIHEML